MENGEYDKENMQHHDEIVEVEMSEQEELDEEMSDTDNMSNTEAMDMRNRGGNGCDNDTSGVEPPLKKEYKSQYQLEEETDPDDLYRPEGILELDIDKFSDFARGPADAQQRLSKPVFVRGLPWKILAIPRDQSRCSGQRTNKALGFFLQCNGDSEMVAWNCIATATLKVLSQKDGQEDHVRRISHTFYPKENDWGYSQFMSCDQLLNSESGYIKNDTIRLQVIVSADAPHGVHWDSKKHAGFIGLKNQGATCYMNSLLQAFFFTNQLRKAVYEMPTEEDDAESSVALAMQRVFFDLQYSDKPVGTKKLTKSFGWDSLDSFLQHDVQELCRVLLDNLESKMKGTKVEGTIPSLFRGRMKSFIRCTDVDYESSHEDFFYDVQLNVKGNADIIQSFHSYIASERLDGENKYDAGRYGLQPAEKGVKFLTFPPILHLQLMRFQYDASIDANVKINDRLEFPERLNLNEFVEGRDENDDYTYCLHAVLVHSGDFHGGHYVVFINTKLNQPASSWCKFDDDVVSRSSFKDAVAANYGGDDLETPGRVFTNAYMLVYVRQSEINEVLCPITDNDIPRHLRSRFEAERTEEINRKKEKQEAHLFTEIALITEDRFVAHHGFDLFDLRLLEDECLRERVKKKMTIDVLYDFVGQRLDITSEFRLWMFTDTPIPVGIQPMSSLSRLRPTSIIHRSQKQLEEVFESDRNLLFVEMPAYSGPITQQLVPYDDKNDMMMFVKLFNEKRRELMFVGHFMMNFREPLDRYADQICEAAQIPKGTKLKFYEEISPDKVSPIHETNSPMCSDGVLLEINDGGVLIIEIDDPQAEITVQEFVDLLYNEIDVEVVGNNESNCFVFSQHDYVEPVMGTINLNWTMPILSEWIGRHIKFDPERILLWKVSAFNEKPTQYLTDIQYKSFRVRELLSLVGSSVHDPRRQKRYRVIFTKMPVRVCELENRRQMKVQMMDEKMNVMDATLFPEKNGTVESILEEAKREFKFSANGTGVLRLVYVGLSPNSTRVYQVFDNQTRVMEVHQKIISPTMYTARVEEIPLDQMQVKPNEHLLPVAHFDKEPSRMFGTPFLFKVTDREPLCKVRDRIRETLDIPEKDFDKYKFALIAQSRVIRQLDMQSQAPVNLAELRHSQVTSVASAPLLGIDHLNKSRGARTGHATEKAIVIHN